MIETMTTVSVRVEQNIGDWREGEIRILERTPRIDTMIEDGRLTVGNWFQSVEDPATNAVVEDLNTRAQAEAIAELVAPGDEGFAADVLVAHDSFPTEYKTPGFLGHNPALGPPILTKDPAAELAAARESAETRIADLNAELDADPAPRTRKRRRATTDEQPAEVPDA